MASQEVVSGEIESTLADDPALRADARKTAEALMRKLVPDLYQALVDAGEIEE